MSEPDTVTLREYVEALFEAADKAVKAALAAQERETAAAFLAAEKAIHKSDVNAEKWRENANEWRASMLDRETKFASRAEMEAELKATRVEIASLKERLDTIAGRAGGSAAMWGYVVGGFAFLLLVLNLMKAWKP